MKNLNNRGNVLIYTVIAMTMITLLGTGVYYMTATSTFSGISANNLNRAQALAEAGINYALIKNLTVGRVFNLANNDKFQIVISGDTIESTGIVNEGTPYETRRKMTTTKTGFAAQADISFAKDIASFLPGVRESTPGFVIIDQAAGRIELGRLIASQFGSVWYSGSAAQGNCQSGKCDFGSGFRVYFIFKQERVGSDIPHGFTFAVFNGTDNSYTSAGGEIAMPELLAYGGNSCAIRNASNVCTSFLDPSGKGIKPPKLAVEFDGRPNFGNSFVCPPTSGNSNSREDGVRNHMSYIFWGDNTTACASRENSLTYDDNRHGAGGGSDPMNAVSIDNLDTADYFTGYDISPRWIGEWLWNTAKVYAVRIEVTRAAIKNQNNKYYYSINTWIKQCASEDINAPDACSEFTGFANTKTPFNPDPPDLPNLKRTIELDQIYHDKFEKFLFGWTTAAGSASRANLRLTNFRLNFVEEPAACGGYGIWNNLGIPGSTSYFKINGIGCTAVSNGSLIGNIGPNGIINGYTDSACTISSAPSSISYTQAMSVDVNKNCAVNFSSTDR